MATQMAKANTHTNKQTNKSTRSGEWKKKSNNNAKHSPLAKGRHEEEIMITYDH